MKDTIKPVRVPRVRVRDRIHGHTRFDLFDVNTKAYKRVESDNIVTDAVEDFLKSYGAWGMSPFFTAAGNTSRGTSAGYTINNLGYLKYLFGGLLLFDSEIDTDSLFMPAGVKMTANGAMGNSNSGDCTEFGSYNSGESSVTEDTATMVYDFATNQGNGDIACACLTSYQGGLIGYGNESGYRYTQSPISYSSGAEYGAPMYLPYDSSSGYAQRICLWHSNKQYSLRGFSYGWGIVASGTTSLPVDVKQFPVEEVLNPISTNGAYGIHQGYEDTFNFSFGALSGDYACTIPYKDKIYLYPVDRTIAVGDTFRVVELDFTNRVATDITITNNSPEAIYTSQYSAYYQYGGFMRFAPFKITDTEMVFIAANNGSWSGKLYSCELTDSSWTDLGITTTRETMTSPWNEDGTLLLMVPSDDSSKAYPLILGDTVNKTALPINGQLRIWDGGSSMEAVRAQWMDYEHPFIKYSMRTYSYGSPFGAYKNPLYLATINNLDSPVVKTTAKTMKVTYTLTLGSGE